MIGIPDSGPRIVDCCGGLPSVRTEVADDLVAAVRLARQLTPAGWVVLPPRPPPSYGRFRNLEHRSEAFPQAIQETAPYPKKKKKNFFFSRPPGEFRRLGQKGQALPNRAARRAGRACCAERGADLL